MAGSSWSACVTWYLGWKAFAKEQRGRGILETILHSKDPTSFSVLLEDTAALTGHDVRAAVKRIKAGIQEKYPRIRRISFDTTTLG